MMKTEFLRKSLLCTGMSAALVLTAQIVPSLAFAEEAVTEADAGVSLDALDNADIDAAWKNPEAAKYVTLGDLDLLEVTQYRYIVSDQDVEYELQSSVYEYGEMVSGEAGEYGDMITMDLSYVVDGEEYTEAGYMMDLGYEEISAEFDELLDGCKVGDELTLTQEFGEDYAPFDEWLGASVDITAVITNIERMIYPDLTDEWVAEHTEYGSIDEYRAAASENLQAYYDEESKNELLQNVISAAMEECTFEGYPQEMYDNAYAAMQAQYEEVAQMWGMQLEDLYEAYGMDEDILAESAESMVHYQLFLAAYAEAENVTVTADEIKAYLENFYESMGYTAAEEMLGDYPLSDIAMAVAEMKISETLLANADVSIEEYNSDAENILFEDDEDSTEEWSEFDDWEDLEIIEFDTEGEDFEDDAEE